MSTETRTQRYDGLYPSQVQEAYAADAAQAAAAGWYVTAEQWIGQTLVVTYTQRALAGPVPVAPVPVAESTPPRGGRLSRGALVVVGAILAGAALGLVFIGRGDTSRQSVLTSACDDAMTYAASFDVMSDTNEQLDGSFTVCESVADWVVASGRHPAALDGVDPYAYLANSCDASSGRALTGTAVCLSLAATSDTQPSQPAPVVPPGRPGPTPAPVATAPSEQPTYLKVSSRQWSKIVKSPDEYVGDALQAWACITQFDPASTGVDMFRGQVSNRKLKGESWFGDGDNAFFSGPPGLLAGSHEGDVVELRVRSTGTYEYATVEDTKLTVPLFTVDAIDRIGKSPACIIEETPTPSPAPTFRSFGDGNLSYLWDLSVSCGYADSCWGMLVVASDGCPNSLYVELQVLDDDDNVIGFTNATAGAMFPGQQAKLTFDTYEDGADTARLTQMSCY